MTAPAKVTPMMAQYLDIKDGVGEQTLLFYRMGDFYELFFNDAVRAAEALDIALTKRGKHQGEDIPMCGVPVHSAEGYLARLIKRGFRVAVCEQTESPAEAKKRGSKSVVKRDVVRVVTPGTLTEESLLDARRSNYIAALAIRPAGDMAVAWSDVSVGSFQVAESSMGNLAADLAALSPSELVIPESLFGRDDMREILAGQDAALTPLPAAKFNDKSAARRLQDRYDVETLEAFGDFSKSELSAAGALLDYLELTQAGERPELSPPRRSLTGQYLSIDPATRASLEIDRTQKGERTGSLLWAIDRTVTGPGSRKLNDWLSRPLTNLSDIQARQQAIAFFKDRSTARDDIRDELKQTSDLARAVSRLALSRGGPRDLAVVRATLGGAGPILAALDSKDGPLPDNLAEIRQALDITGAPALSRLLKDLSSALKEDPPLLVRDGGFIAPGWSGALDEFRGLRDDSRKIIAGLQSKYAETAGVQSLKIRHNNVLGYFIEVTAKHGDTLMGMTETFIHRQTLASAMRFTTGELADLDAKVSGAADKALALELELFESLRAQVQTLADPLRRIAEALAELDIYTGMALWSEDMRAVQPVISDSGNFEISGGRHPVVEAALERDGERGFTPNDCHLHSSGEGAPRLSFVTGPNMAGKSTYLRQNALMIILAQAGLDVPAARADIGIADRLFSRVGASDDLARGRSTFMMEMIETATILNQSSDRSFVILDEIGRGTATFDGLSIAWAAAEYLHDVIGCRALFATHYHELTSLSATLDHAGNLSLKAKEWEGDLIFLHEVGQGPADRSYGIQVAKLAGLPPAAIKRAKAVLSRLESQKEGSPKQALGDLPLFQAEAPPPPPPSEIENAIAALDVDDLSPRQALDLLYDLKVRLKRLKRS